MFDVWHFDNWSEADQSPTGAVVNIRAALWTGDNIEDAETMLDYFSVRLLEEGKSGVVVALGPQGERVGDVFELNAIAA